VPKRGKKKKKISARLLSLSVFLCFPQFCSWGGGGGGGTGPNVPPRLREASFRQSPPLLLKHHLVFSGYAVLFLPPGGGRECFKVKQPAKP